MQQRHASSSPVLRATVAGLACLVVAGMFAYAQQNRDGLGVTGMSRDVPWGLYISQFTFLVGIAASSVLVVLPRYAHAKSDLAPLVLVGESVSVSALVAAFSFVLVDLGRPSRVLGVILHAAPSSLMFWDIATLSVYFLLCLTIVAASLLLPTGAHPAWLRRLALASVPFAFGIHIVTALLYAGLAARPGWMTAILAPKFLATAFASGSSLLLLLAGSLRKNRRLPIDGAATDRLAIVMTYALCATLLFSALEVFTAVYSGIPATEHHALHLLVPQAHHAGVALLLLVSLGLDCLALAILLLPRLRRSSSGTYAAGAMIIIATLIEKGLIFIPSGFEPSAFGENIGYHPSITETLIAGGIYSVALLVFITLLGPAIAHGHDPTAKREPASDTASASSAEMLGKASAH
jgi:molybdopterin-containing oxidoreductase family membrane subunit